MKSLQKLAPIKNDEPDQIQDDLLVISGEKRHSTLENISLFEVIAYKFFFTKSRDRVWMLCFQKERRIKIVDIMIKE